MDIQEIRNKYGVQQADAAGDSLQNLRTLIANGNKVQNDAAGSAIENLKALVSKAKKAVKAKSGDYNAMARLMNELVMARSAARSEYDALAKEAYNLTGELDNLSSNFKKRK